MSRGFSIVRRRPHLVDIVTPIQDGVTGYRWSWAQNFDGVFVDFLTTGINGYLDKNVNRDVLHSMPGRHVRVVFDPTTYSITDSNQFWMKFTPVTGGTPGTPSGLALVVPDHTQLSTQRLTIQGTAPGVATIAGSLCLELPRTMQDLVIDVDGSNALMLAMSPTSPEIKIEATANRYTISEGLHATLVVRGDGSAATFSANFTHAFPK